MRESKETIAYDALLRNSKERLRGPLLRRLVREVPAGDGCERSNETRTRQDRTHQTPSLRVNCWLTFRIFGRIRTSKPDIAKSSWGLSFE